jgi:hypothetical protein
MSACCQLRCAWSILVVPLAIFASERGAFPAAAQQAASTAATAFRWVETPGRSIELRHGDRPVIRYICAPHDNSTPRRHAETYKPFHHVYTPDGRMLLTKGDADGLYPHHRGLFYGFSQVTYGNGQRCDVWHCTDGAYQAHQRVLSQRADAEAASLVAEISWHGRGGERFATEQRGISVRMRQPGVLVDFTSRLETADGRPIRLDGDPQHAGFHFRAAQEVAARTAGETYFLRTDGQGTPGETRNWEPDGRNPALNAQCENRPWLAMCFTVAGQRYTVLYVDHPANPKPARYSERDYGRFGSYFVAEVTADKPLDVKYRVWVRAGEMAADQCAALAHEFVGDGM